MIGKLKGRIDEIEEDGVILDVGGVGYVVFCSGRTLRSLDQGVSCELIIETHVREDHIHLYGFSDTAEREWFRLLLTVQGVGNKTALAIQSAYGPQQLVQSIVSKDIAAFKAISGIGPKLAERIVTELKDKAIKMPTSGFQGVPAPAGKGGKKPAVTAAHNSTEDAISALVNLGYSRSEAYGAAVKAGQKSDSGTIDELIKLSLKELAKT